MLRDIDIPEPIAKAFREIIDKAPADAILDLARGHKTLRQGGFKPVEKNIGIFRDRLQALAKGIHKGKDALFLSFLRDVDLSRSFIIVLSEKALRFGLGNFLSFYGRDRFLANLLLDERSEIQQIALDYMENGDWESKKLPHIEEAISAIKDIYRPFLENIMPFIDGDAPGDTLQKTGGTGRHNTGDQARSSELKALRDLVKRQEEKISKYKEKNAALSRVFEIEKNKGYACAEKIINLEKGMEVVQEENQRLKTTLENLREESKAMGNSFYMDGLINKADTLLKDAILHRTYDLDPSTMLRLNLNRSIDLTQSYYILAYENLAYDPEFKSIFGKLIEKAGKTRIDLLIDDGCSPLFHLLMDRVSRAAAPDSLNEIYTDLCAMDSHRILTGAEMSMLYGLCHEKMDAFYSRYGQEDLSRLRDTSNPVWYLKNSIREGAPFLLLLDGYNITHTLKDIFYPYFEKGKPSEKARKRLLSLMERIAGKAPESTIKVYFDSEYPEEIQYTSNIKVIFSGIPGKHSADDRIIGDLTFYYASENMALPCCLTTDDRDLAAQASRLGAMTMSLREFTVFLK